MILAASAGKSFSGRMRAEDVTGTLDLKRAASGWDQTHCRSASYPRPESCHRQIVWAYSGSKHGLFQTQKTRGIRIVMQQNSIEVWVRGASKTPESAVA